MRYFGFTLTRAQQRNIFAYKVASPAALEGVDLDALLLVLKAQNKVAQDCTTAQMCDMLLEPFQRVFVDGRDALLDGLCKIKHVTKINWKTRLARLKTSRKAHAARRALIKREDDAAKVVRTAALRAEVAAKPRASGVHKKRKAPKPKASKAKKQKTTRDTADTPRVADQTADVAEEGDEGVALGGAQDVAMLQVWQAAAQAGTQRFVAHYSNALCETDDDDDIEDERCAPIDNMPAQHMTEGVQTTPAFDVDAFMAVCLNNHQ